MIKTEETGFVSRPGIVDKVHARRKGGDVVRLDVMVRVQTEFPQTYYTDEAHVDEMMFSMPPDSRVNPGDVVSINMQFAAPFGQRFKPALEASTSDDDVLEVEVEAGLIEDSKEDDDES